MATVEDFKLRITVEGEGKIRSVSAAVGDLKKDVDAFGQVGGPLGNTINGIVGRLGTMATAGLAAGAVFVALGMKAIQLADQIADISDASGVAAGALLNFKASLIEAGGKSDDFSVLATKLAQNLGDAATGGEAAQKSFQKLGVFVRDANGNIRDSGDVLRDVIAKLAAIENPAIRSAMAVELLGKNAKNIDFTKVNAINDPFKDEQIKQLAKYQEAIDKISNSVANGLLTVFGKLAIAINNAQEQAAKAQADAESRGNTLYPSPVTGQLLERPMSKKEKEEYELRKKIADAYKDQAREMQRLEKIGKPASGAGDFGATPEATLKAIAESQKRIAQSGIEARKLEQLKGANDLLAIEINAAAEIAKQREEIFGKERLTDAQKTAEFAAKKAEIEKKAANDTAKYQSQQNAKIYSELEAQRQKSAEELAAEETRINNIVESTRQLSVEQQYQLDAQKRKNQLLVNTAIMSDREAKNTQELFALEEERLALLRKIAEVKDLPYEERLAREAAVNDQIKQRKVLTEEAQAADKANAESFSVGWQKSYANFIDSSRNAADQAATLFKTFTTGLEDAFVKFVQTGKLSFKDLINSLIADMARAQIRNLLGNLGGGGGGGGKGGLFGGSIIPGFLAAGGPAAANTPYIVGEKGPELFVPRSAGTVIPNSSLSNGSSGQSTFVTYNVNAVDAMSFKQMLAQDPTFIHAVAEQGRRTLPGAR